MLPGREHELLQTIFQYLKEFGGPIPRSNSWFAGQINRKSNHITQLKRKLREKKYLDAQNMPTQKARDYIKNLEKNTMEVQVYDVPKSLIGIYGEVVAGFLDPDRDGVHVVLDELDNPTETFLVIPDTAPDRQVFALKVVGQSMEQEGIFEGDYVLVEKLGRFEQPSPQDMIVAKYLPKESEPTDRNALINPDDLVGPTVKIFVRKFGKSEVELGWRKDNKGNPWAIRTKELHTIGRVVGIYRNLQK
jgi:SOS-response transcriptional repressor LexA